MVGLLCNEKLIYILIRCDQTSFRPLSNLFHFSLLERRHELVIQACAPQSVDQGSVLLSILIEDF